MNGTYREQWEQRFERDGRLRSALDRFLVPQEAVEVVAYGAAGCAVIATRARALVYKRGVKAGIPFGYRLKPFEFESVVAINVRPIEDGVILAIHAPLKVGSCSVYWLDERDDAWKARNAVVTHQDDREAFESVAVELRDLMAAHHARHGRATPPPAPRISPVDAPPERKACTACGVEVEAGWRYCPECGTSFGEPAERWTWPRTIHGAGH